MLTQIGISRERCTVSLATGTEDEFSVHGKTLSYCDGALNRTLIDLQNRKF